MIFKRSEKYINALTTEQLEPMFGTLLCKMPLLILSILNGLTLGIAHPCYLP
jgi:hypothetical protein